MTNPAHAEAAPRHTKPVIQKAAEAFMALAFNIHAVRETIAPVNEQIKKEVGDAIWQAVQNQLADSQERKLKPGLTSWHCIKGVLAVNRPVPLLARRLRQR